MSTQYNVCVVISCEHVLNLFRTIFITRASGELKHV